MLPGAVTDVLDDVDPGDGAMPASGNAALGRTVLLIEPLKERNFALLWIATTASLLGGGMWLVSLTWIVYDATNAPSALATVGSALSTTMLISLLLTGVLTDRFSRKVLLIVGNVVRATAVLALAFVALTDHFTLTAAYLIAAVYGIGEAIFGPPLGAIVPELLPKGQLLQGNSLQQLARPLALRFLGPALGGVLIGAFGVGSALGTATGVFLASTLATASIRSRPANASRIREEASLLREMNEGFRFVWAHTWIWATLASWFVSLVLFLGPFQVLVPFVVKTELGASAISLGLVFGAAGLGGVGGALLMASMGDRWRPRQPVRFMYCALAVAVGCVSLFGIVAHLWQAIAVSLLEGVAATVGTIAWVTLIQRAVPSGLLGRVQSLDWLVSVGTPLISFALTGPASSWLGARTALVLAGVLGAACQMLFLLIPGVSSGARPWSETEDPPVGASGYA
jgi:MFS family permease